MIRKLFIILFPFSFLTAGCDTSQPVAVQDHPEIVQMGVRFVMVPYRSPLGPGEERDMMAGSFEAAPDFNPLAEPERLSPSPFGCYGSEPHPQVHDKYSFRYFYLYFDKQFIEQADDRFQFTYWRANSNDGPNGETLAIWRCFLPMTDFSENIVVNFLESYFDNNHSGIEYRSMVRSNELDNLP